jgi:polysaccharide biosynthesis/export protein
MCGTFGMRVSAILIGLVAAGAAHAQEPPVENGAGALVSVSPPVSNNEAVAVTPPPASPPAPSQKAAQPSPQPVVAKPAPAASSVATAKPALVVPPDYVIGPDDILSVEFWRDKDMSADVVVRPDGKITLPLLNDLDAGGLTPEQLRERVQTEAGKYISDPNVNIVVKQINSRRVFIMGMVGKAGAYPLSAPTTVLQFLSMAGGVSEFADTKKIVIMRTENGVQKALKFNYADVSRGKNLKQNILLQPGDTVVVP